MRNAAAVALALIASSALAYKPYPTPPPSYATNEYAFSPTTPTPLADGRVTVTMPTGLTAPTVGYIPFWVDARNSTPSAQKLKVTLTGTGNGSNVEKTFELRGGESRRVYIPVPANTGGAYVEVSGPVVQERTSVYFAPYMNTSILAIGTEDEFRDFVGKGPSTSSPDTAVLVLPPSDLPEELSAYVGFSAVVLLGREPQSLTDAQRRVLEAYAATGGYLVLERPGRSFEQYFPLAKQKGDPEELRYGMGKLLACDPDQTGCGVRMLTQAYTNSLAVAPNAAPPAYARGLFGRSYYYGAEAQSPALLTQAAPPVGRFLVIMILFALAVGPGSIYVARKRGPLFVLVTIPSIALVTCVSIALYSAMVDGFSVHATTRGYTLLDRKGARAVTVSLDAFYANLAPSKAEFGASDAVLFPADRYTQQTASMSWNGGPVFGGDFIPSRTYREWGVLSVTPTRARLSLRSGKVLNALGGHVKEVMVKQDGQLFVAENVGDGGEATLRRAKLKEGLPLISDGGQARFRATVEDVIRGKLEEGEFLALMDGPAFSPMGGLNTDHNGDLHLVRGEVE